MVYHGDEGQPHIDPAQGVQRIPGLKSYLLGGCFFHLLDNPFGKTEPHALIRLQNTVRGNMESFDGRIDAKGAKKRGFSLYILAWQASRMEPARSCSDSIFASVLPTGVNPDGSSTTTRHLPQMPFLPQSDRIGTLWAFAASATVVPARTFTCLLKGANEISMISVIRIPHENPADLPDRFLSDRGRRYG
jgi:hypothetical protein